MTTADDCALLQVGGMRGHTRALRSDPRALQEGETVRADATVEGSHTPGVLDTTGVEPSLADLIAELASAGLVSVVMSDDGDISYALTPQGQLAARLMAMSRHAHALVLLGALVGASDDPN